MTQDVLPVGAVVDLLRQAILAHPFFSDLWITGEVVSASVVKGHCYLTIADEQGHLRGVLWRSNLARQSHAPRAGMQVAVHGHLDIYPARGELQIVIDSVQPAGLGLAALEFERLRSQLEAEGLFDPARKRPLPAAPACIGVVTSETGAVWHDIQNVLRRRYPLTTLILAPAQVQGDGAPDSIAAALAALERDGRPDVIIVARGGGAPEDLAAFNAERVVRAIFACSIPVVSGVGHETDVTLADFVADLRAPTPSAAAELCTPSLAEAAEDLLLLRNALVRSMRESLAARGATLQRARRELAQACPAREISRSRERVAILRGNARRSWQSGVAATMASIASQRRALRALDPEAVLNRGYSVISVAGSTVPVSSASEVNAGMAIAARLAEGRIDAWVTSTATAPKGARKAARR